MKGQPSERAGDAMADEQCSRSSRELRKSSQLTRRSASSTCATKALSFIAVDLPVDSSNAAQAPEAASTAVPKVRANGAPQWGSGAGWRKLTERGKLIMLPSSGGCLTVEGCTVGFCVATYEGTKEEQAILNGGKYAVEALVKVSPGGVFDGQAMCVVFDMAKASDVSGACDLCSLQLNTSTRQVKRTLSLLQSPEQERITHILAKEVAVLTPNTWVHVVIHYACSACSVWVGGECVRQHLKLSRPHPSFPPFDDFYNNTVGVAVYGKTRMHVKSFRILQPTQLHAVGKQLAHQGLCLALSSGRAEGSQPVTLNAGCIGTQKLMPLSLVIYLRLCFVAGNILQDVVALTAVKEVLTETILLPLQMPGLLTGLLEPPKGVMLFGAPGTGKTMLATAVASVAGVSFFCCSAASLTSKWRGESEKLLRALFKAAKARAPSLIFIDEADALCSQRGREDEHEASRRFKAELLQQIDGLGTVVLEASPQTATRVALVAATNAPWDIDEALRRRLEKRVLLPLPDLSARQQLLQHLLRQQQARPSLHHYEAQATPPTHAGLDLEHLARRTDGFSCADLRSLCREAAMQPVRRLLREAPSEALLQGALKPDDIKQPVTADDFEVALETTRPSVSSEAALRYVKWNDSYGST
ncbi:hypothetical protein Esti_003381 [Eimeria stiedai]